MPEDLRQAGVLIDKLKEAEGLIAQFDRGDSPFTNRELAAAIFTLAQSCPADHLGDPRRQDVQKG